MGLVRFNSDWTLDTSYRPTTAGFAGTDAPFVWDVAVRADGRPVAVGSFTALDGTRVPRNLVRVDEDGAWDPSFNAAANDLDGPVSTVIEELDTTGAPTGLFLVGGTFTHFGTTVVPADLVRLTADGTLDATFNSGRTGFAGLSHQVMQVVPERGTDGLPTGSLLVRGVFSSVNGTDGPDGLVRLFADGGLDLSFDQSGTGLSPMGGTQLVVQEASTTTGLPTGKLLVGGDFTHYNGGDVAHAVPIGLLRMGAGGVLDTTFGGGAGFNNSIFAGAVRAVLVEREPSGPPTGNLIVGGVFTAYNGAAVTANLVRLGKDGIRDPSFNSAPATGTDGAIEVLVGERDALCAPTGLTWAGGAFSTYGGAASQGLVRILGNGKRDATANTGSGVQGTVYAIVEETDGQGVPTGRLVIGGSFTDVGGRRRMGIARVDVLGAADEAFAGQLR